MAAQRFLEELKTTGGPRLVAAGSGAAVAVGFLVPWGENITIAGSDLVTGSESAQGWFILALGCLIIVCALLWQLRCVPYVVLASGCCVLLLAIPELYELFILARDIPRGPDSGFYLRPGLFLSILGAATSAAGAVASSSGARPIRLMPMCLQRPW